MPDNNKNLYDYLLSSGKVKPEELGDFATFNAGMADPNRAKKLYSNLTGQKGFTPDELGDETTFLSHLDGLAVNPAAGKEQDTPVQSPTQEPNNPNWTVPGVGKFDMPITANSLKPNESIIPSIPGTAPEELSFGKQPQQHISDFKATQPSLEIPGAMEQALPQQKTAEEQYFEPATQKMGGAQISSTRRDLNAIENAKVDYMAKTRGEDYAKNYKADLETKPDGIGSLKDFGTGFTSASKSLASNVVSGLDAIASLSAKSIGGTDVNPAMHEAVKKWANSGPQPKDNLASAAGATAVYIIPAIVSTLTGSAPVAAATTGMFGLSGFGEGGDVYKDFKESKGEAPNPNAELASRLMYAMAYAAPIGEALHSGLAKGVGYVSDKVFVNGVASSLANNVNARVTGEAILKEFLKKNPQGYQKLATELMKGGAHGAVTMNAIELTKKATEDFVMGKDVSAKDYWDTFKNAVESGLVFGATVKPFAMYAQNRANTQRRDATGYVTLTEGGIEVLPWDGKGAQKGLTPDGKMVDLAPEQLKNSFTMTTEHFNQMVNEFKSTGAVAGNVDRDAYSEVISKGIKNVATGGNVFMVPNGDNPLFIVGKNEDGTVTAKDVNGASYTLPGVTKPKIVNVASLYNSLMKTYDAKQADRQKYNQQTEAQNAYEAGREQADVAIRNNFQALAQPDGKIHTGIIKDPNGVETEVVIISQTPGGMAILQDGSIVDASNISAKQEHPFDLLYEQHMAEFDAQNNPALQQPEVQAQTTFNWNGRNMQLFDVSDKNNMIVREVDANGEPVGKPESMTQDQYLKIVEQQAAGNPAPALQSYTIGGKEVEFTPTPEGEFFSSQLEGVNTQEEAQALADELESRIGKDNVVSVAEVPAAGMTPASYSLKVRARTPVDEPYQPKTTEAIANELFDGKETTATYTLNGQPIERGKALARVKAAIFDNNKSKIENLQISGDTEMQDMIDKAFPKPPAKFTIGKKKATSEDAMNWIDAADTLEELKQLKIENGESAPDVRDAYATRVKDFVPETTPEEVDKLVSGLFAEESVAEVEKAKEVVAETPAATEGTANTTGVEKVTEGVEKVTEGVDITEQLFEQPKTESNDKENTERVPSGEPRGETVKQAGPDKSGSRKETGPSGDVQGNGRGQQEPSGTKGQALEDKGAQTTPEPVKEDRKPAFKNKTPEEIGGLFYDRLSKLKKDKPEEFWSVDLPDKEELVEAAKDGRIIDLEGYQGLVTKDGNITGLFNYGEKNMSVANKVLQEAVAAGGNKLDAFDTTAKGKGSSLARVYARKGFREVARVDFNPEYAPPDMPQEIKDLNPDIVVMVYDPNNEMKIKSRRFDKYSYDEAMDYRDSYVTPEPIPDHNKSGETHDFFSDVVTGKSDKYKPVRPWQPLMEFSPEENAVRNTYDKFNGHFDEHIATSIPGFRDIQIKVVSALNQMYGDKEGLIYDIGGSEGGFVKTLTELSGGKLKSINLDANGEMEAVHNATPVEGSTFVKEAFGPGFEWDGVNYPQHEPTQKADVVHESMTFQFIDEKRSDKLDELVEKYIKPDGLFITEEKVHPESKAQWNANEAMKDTEFKPLYYNPDQIDAKREEVLVGMVKNQTTYKRYKNELLKKFDYVEEYWDAGNFKGLVASNDKAKIDQFLGLVGDTDTKFSEKNIFPEDRRPAYQARGLYAGKVKAPKFNNLTDLTKWLDGWAKKNNTFISKEAKADDATFVKALVKHTMQELKALEETNDYEYIGFYDYDIPTRLNPELQRFAAKRYGRELTPEEISLYHMVSGFASPQASPVMDSSKGLDVFDKYMQSKILSARGDKQSTVWVAVPVTDKEGNPILNKKGEPKTTKVDTGELKFNEQGNPIMNKVTKAYAEDSLIAFQGVLNKFDGDLKAAMDWVMSKHSYAEISKIMGTPTKGDEALTTHEYLTKEKGGFGIFGFTGAKLGSYILNRLGEFSTVTKDMWYARTMARLTGEDLQDKEGEALKKPWDLTVEGKRKRALADKAWGIVAKRIGTTPADVQQKMWEFEKRLYGKLGVGSDTGYASEGFTKRAKELEPDLYKTKVDKAAEKVNTDPTEAQKTAGNYQKGHVNVQGFNITIENPKGSVRSGVDEDGKAWETEMKSHYGYFKRSTGKDGDHIDVFVGDNPESRLVFVVDQIKPVTGEFDESKVMMGYNSVEEAKDAYMANYSPDWKGFSNITEVPSEEFKVWLNDGARQRKPFSDYQRKPAFSKRVWHGSPYLFDKFSNEKIGTGEGAQAFGFGLYFTEREDIARNYANMTKITGLIVDGQEFPFKQLEEQYKHSKFIQDRIKEFEEYATSSGDIPFLLSQTRDSIRYKEEYASMEDRIKEINKELKDIIQELQGTGYGMSSSDWYKINVGTYKTPLIYKLEEKQGEVRNNRDYNELEEELTRLRNEQIRIGATREKLIKERTSLERKLNESRWDPFPKASLDEAKEFFELLSKTNDFVKNKGRQLYDVVIHGDKTPDQYEFMEWYKPVPRSVLEKVNAQAIKEFGERNGFTEYFNANENNDWMSGDKSNIPDGWEFYETVIPYKLWQVQEPKDISAFLLRAGIDGISYPPNSLSRKNIDDVKERNYVVFDDNAVAIQQRISFRLSKDLGSLSEPELVDIVIKEMERTANLQTPTHVADNSQVPKILKGKTAQKYIDEVASSDWAGVTVGGEIIIHSDLNAENALVTWAHEKAHDTVYRRFKTVAASDEFFRDFADQVGPAELRRVVPFEYWMEGKEVMADEYIATMVEKYVSDPEVYEAAPDDVKNFIFGVISEFTNPKNIEDAKDSINLARQGKTYPDAYASTDVERGLSGTSPDNLPGPTSGGGGLRQASGLEGKPAFEILKDFARYRITPDQAKALPYKTKLPTSEIFKQAVENTPDSKITDEGLVIKVVRFQKEEQEGEESVRTGVFYLPASDTNIRYYRTGKMGYGGKVKHEGETLIKRPIFVKGATGGKAPEAAYDQIKGKGATKQLSDEIFSSHVLGQYGRRVDASEVYNFLEEHGSDGDIAWNMVEVSKQGNTLRYAIQENIIAHAVREAGYDAVIGYSTKRDGTPFISEIFDVRETTYPSSNVEADIHESFLQEQQSLNSIEHRIAYRRKPQMIVDRKQVQTTGEHIKETLVNNKLALENWMEDVKTIVPKIEDYENPLLKDQLAKSKVTTKLSNFEHGPYKRVVRVVADVTKPGMLSPTELTHYMIAVHGKERNQKFWDNNPMKVGEDFSGLTELKAKVRAEAKTPMEQLRIDVMNLENFADYYKSEMEKKMTPAQIKELWGAVGEISKLIRDEMLDSGMISKAYYDELGKMYQNYIPLRAWENQNPEQFEFGRGVGEYTAPIIHAKGRKSLADDPIATLLQMANTAYISGERNRVKKAAGELVRNNAAALKDFVQYKKVYFVDSGALDPQGNPIITETIDRPDQSFFDQGLVTTKVPKDYTKRRTSDQAKEFEVEFYDNGNKYVLVFQGSDPAVARAINNREASVGIDYLNKVVSTDVKIGNLTVPSITSMSRYLSSINTTYSIDFPLVNFLRDAPMALLSEWVYGDAKEAAKMFPKMVEAEGAMRRKIQGKQDMTNPIDQHMEDFFNYGGPTGFAYLKDVDAFKQSLKNDVRRINRIKNPFVRMEVGFRAGLQAIGHLAEWSEAITRFGIYLNHIEAGDTKENAALAAKRATVNFDQKGRLTATLNGLYTFFNAAIQAVDKYFQLWGKNWKKMAGIHMFLAVQGFLNAWMLDLFGGEDKDGVKNYDKVTDYSKRNNIIVPVVGSDKTVTFPLPQILRKFSGAGWDAYDLMSGRKSSEQVLLDQLSSLPSDISPIDTEGFLNREGDLSVKPLVPSFLRPIAELEANENFMKLPISPEPFSLDLAAKIADTRRAYKDVNKIAQWTTDKLYELGGGDETGFKYVYKNGELQYVPALLDISPESIEHLFESYFGGIGKFANRTWKTTSSVFGAGKKLLEGQDFKDAVKDISINSVPVANRFLRTPMGDPLEKEFRKVRKDFENKIKILNQAEKDGDWEKFSTIYDQMGPQIEQYKAIMSTFDKLDKVKAKLLKVDPVAAEELDKESRENMKAIIKIK